MPSYRCTLELDVTADNPQQAAEYANADARDPQLTRWTWTVKEFEGPNIGQTTDVEVS